MTDVEINDLGTVGSVRDTPAYLLPPEAWTLALNMRVVDSGIESLLGWEQVFGTPGVAPHFAIPVKTASAVFWLYVSLTKAYGFDGTTHTDITRGGGGGALDYGATGSEQWNGTFLANIPLLNNGVDVPQFWSPVQLATDLQDLTNWPSTLRAKVVRAFGAYLVAINCTKSGTSYPHMVKWSHPADPGTVPSSWDETDPTTDAGEIELPDSSAGVLQDALPLSDTMYLYKENSTWKMRYIGGRFIFDFGKAAWLQTGILAPRCVATVGDGDRHVVATQDDIIWHDGNRVRSILNERQRRRLFNEIDTNNYFTSYMFDNSPYGEMWFCYPSSGATYPNRALIMNYSRGGDLWQITEADGITFRWATSGPIESPADETWEANENLWDDDDGPWSSFIRRRTVACGTDATKFYGLDVGTTRDGVAFTGTLQREGLSVLGKKRNGDWIVDFNRWKQMDEIWPKLQGGVVDLRMGYQNLVDGPITWNPAVSFDPASQVVCYGGPVSGRALGLEFSSTSWFRLDGYRLSVLDLGMF